MVAIVIARLDCLKMVRLRYLDQNSIGFVDKVKLIIQGLFNA